MIQITTSRGPNRPQSHLLVVFVELNGGDLSPLVVLSWTLKNNVSQRAWATTTTFETTACTCTTSTAPAPALAAALTPWCRGTTMMDHAEEKTTMCGYGRKASILADTLCTTVRWHWGI